MKPDQPYAPPPAAKSIPAGSPTWSRSRAVRSLGLVVFSLLAVWLTAWLVPLPARLGVPPSAEVRYSDGSPAHVFLAPDEKWRLAVRLDEVDPAYLDALLSIEDARFWWHPGVDPLAVARAVAQDLRAGEIVSGASTLTMQVARMLEPRPRTVRSKLIEAARAAQLELRYSKREVLELYLSWLPFGRNVEGVEAASLWYFGHTARSLSPGEIATLLAVPQDPVHRYPCPTNRARLHAARDGIARRLWEGRSPDDLAAALATAVPNQITPPPRDIPHAARWLRARAPDRDRVETTLDSGVQERVDRLLAAARPGLAAAGIRDAAIVVVDHATAELRALAGGLDFADSHPGAQMITFDAPRSPGSTLKPLLYAAAIDDGLLLPDTLVEDIPTRYGTYSPSNYDDGWSGMVRAEEALSRSLNIPFVALLSRYGVERFLGRLRDAGARHLNPQPGHYGLSLIAGGTELTPLEIAGLYVALAEHGEWRPLTWQAGRARTEGLSLISPGAAWLTRRALRIRDRPDFPSRADLVTAPPQIHWKTGTSFGNRDAWAVGSGQTYTTVVWLGNLDNTPSAQLVGAEAAAPLLFDLLEGLDDGLTAPDLAPDDLHPIAVCALSGRLVGEACPERRHVPAPARVPPGRCPLHVRAEVDVQTGALVGAQCTGSHETTTRTFVQWPNGVRGWMGATPTGSAGLGVDLPARAPDCAPGGQEAPLRITSPGRGEIVLLVPGLPATDQEVPLTADAGPATTLSWFVDGVFLGQVGASERAWWPPVAGTHRVRVMDEGGRTADTTVLVRAEAAHGADRERQGVDVPASE